MQHRFRAPSCSRAPRRPTHACVLLLALAVAGAIGFGATQDAAAEDPPAAPTWDQVANIKEAALHLAQLQKTQGATKVFAFIDACYRTHSLSSQYTKPFEACIAQDYMETQILSIIYSRTPPDALKKIGAPSPKVLVQTMLRRVGAAFAQYKVPKDRILAFQRNLDEHGFPLFFKTVFPEAKMPERVPQPPVGEDTPASASDQPAADKPAPDKSTPEDKPAPEKKQ